MSPNSFDQRSKPSLTWNTMSSLTGTPDVVLKDEICDVQTTAPLLN